MSEELRKIQIDLHRAILKQATEYEHLASALRMQANAIAKQLEIDKPKENG